jgi:hypothetical protein
VCTVTEIETDRVLSIATTCMYILRPIERFEGLQGGPMSVRYQPLVVNVSSLAVLPSWSQGSGDTWDGTKRLGEARDWSRLINGRYSRFLDVQQSCLPNTVQQSF